MAKKKIDNEEIELNEYDSKIKTIVDDFPKFRTDIRAKLAKGLDERIEQLFTVIDKFKDQEKFFWMLKEIMQFVLPKQAEENMNFDGEIPVLKMEIVSKINPLIGVNKDEEN